MKYTIDIKGFKKDLPLCKLNDELYIGAYVMFGDVPLTVHCAKELLKLCPEFDYIVTPEAKAIPLAYEMSKLANKPYIVARKGVKAYMEEPFTVDVRSITTLSLQQLTIDRTEADLLKDKRVLIVDDVISTGASLKAVETLINHAEGKIVAACAPLAEGDAAKRKDIIFLAPLPLFTPEGKIID